MNIPNICGKIKARIITPVNAKAIGKVLDETANVAGEESSGNTYAANLSALKHKSNPVSMGKTVPITDKLNIPIIGNSEAESPPLSTIVFICIPCTIGIKRAGVTHLTNRYIPKIRAASAANSRLVIGVFHFVSFRSMKASELAK